MGINILHAAIAGVMGAIIMTLFIYLFKAIGYGLDIPWLLGTRFVAVTEKRKAYITGMSLHLLLGAFWGMLYVYFLLAMAVPPDWPAGLLYGFSHGIFVGAMIGILSTNHPNIGENRSMSDPGMFGHRWGIGVSVVLLVLHIIYGVSTLLIYDNLW